MEWLKENSKTLIRVQNLNSTKLAVPISVYGFECWSHLQSNIKESWNNRNEVSILGCQVKEQGYLEGINYLQCKWQSLWIQITELPTFGPMDESKILKLSFIYTPVAKKSLTATKAVVESVFMSPKHA